jgi:hypothetical protein
MTNKHSSGKKLQIIYRFLPLALFLAFFLLGVAVNEPQRVLEQAWNICLDCIGIG